jgi:hypothetical protein
MPSVDSNDTTFECLLRGSSGSGDDDGNGAVVGAVVGPGPLEAGTLVEPRVGAGVGLAFPAEEPQPARIRPTRIPIAIRPRLIARIGEVYGADGPEGSTFLTTFRGFSG